MENKYQLVIPTIMEDVNKILEVKKILCQYLPIYEIVIIGDDEVEEYIKKYKDIKFVNEKDIIDIALIKEIITLKEKKFQNRIRAGWYIQQFIKMAYALICKDEYYLLWDSDTIPLKKIDMVNSKGIPYFDMKTEYHKEYFDTISVIFPGISKLVEKSFISEHMLIKTSLMDDLIKKIESNVELKGNTFYEKILDAIAGEKILRGGFSEFETYGTYVMTYYEEEYVLREWKSMRYGSFFYNINNLNSRVINWLGKNYDAISLEKSDKKSKIFSKIAQNVFFIEYFPPSSLDLLSFLLRIRRKFSRNN